MRTHTHLWEEFVKYENWTLALERAKKNKKHWHSVRKFSQYKLEVLMSRVFSGLYRTSEYREKTIYEPKKRTIYKLPFVDRVVHHAVMNILRPILTPILTETCFACVEGRGPHRASVKCSEFVRRYRYCLKCDIRKFYPSISHSVLIGMLRRIIRDRRFMSLLEEIVNSFPGEVNVPIGNYTSQWLGNFYLSRMDNYIKHALRIGAYIRYCDDFLMFSNDKAKLARARDMVGEYLRDKLRLEFSKCDLFDVRQGVDFCGYRHFKGYVIMRKSSARRWLRRKPKRDAVPSFYGQTRWCKSHNLRMAFVRKVPMDWDREIKLLNRR